MPGQWHQFAEAHGPPAFCKHAYTIEQQALVVPAQNRQFMKFEGALFMRCFDKCPAHSVVSSIKVITSVWP
jgi:hypothetical protein